MVLARRSRQSVIIVLVCSLTGMVYILNSLLFSSNTSSHLVHVKAVRLSEENLSFQAHTVKGIELKHAEEIVGDEDSVESPTPPLNVPHVHGDEIVSVGGEEAVEVFDTGNASVVSIKQEFKHDVDPVTKERAAWNNMTTYEREKYQKHQADVFCRRNHLIVQRHIGIGRHLLVNNRSRTAFCFVPKVGCTNLKILFFIVQGVVPLNELNKTRDGVNQDKLEIAIDQLSFSRLPQQRKRRVLQNYYKFVMYRNPVERLLSAYRSKVSRFPLVGMKDDEPHYNWLRKEIYKYKYPLKYRNWLAGEGKEPVNITFPDFVDYRLNYRNRLTHDEHFTTIFALCDPCQVRYDYYGNFNTFEKDAKVLRERIGAGDELLRDGYYSEGESTSDLVPEYYHQLSPEQKRGIVKGLALDLSFYYSVFPFERDSHKRIMNTDASITTFLY